MEEAARLLEAAPGIKYKAALGVTYGAGLRVSEVAHLKVDDIDSTRMLILVEQGKGRRTATLCSRRNCWNCYVCGGAKASGAG
ncbi:phage integrase family protein [Phyllobacterium brassicacearum]|nr:tyrosine-type recombinase/integrase [Phyllobacterium brassicacearum]TDQ15293.1 phage integrase family protein [Phyllobacterium brassicacearum]